MAIGLIPLLCIGTLGIAGIALTSMDDGNSSAGGSTSQVNTGAKNSKMTELRKELSSTKNEKDTKSKPIVPEPLDIKKTIEKYKDNAFIKWVNKEVENMKNPNPKKIKVEEPKLPKEITKAINLNKNAIVKMSTFINKLMEIAANQEATQKIKKELIEKIPLADKFNPINQDEVEQPKDLNLIFKDNVIVSKAQVIYHATTMFDQDIYPDIVKCLGDAFKLIRTIKDIIETNGKQIGKEACKAVNLLSMKLREVSNIDVVPLVFALIGTAYEKHKEIFKKDEIQKYNGLCKNLYDFCELMAVSLASDIGGGICQLISEQQVQILDHIKERLTYFRAVLETYLESVGIIDHNRPVADDDDTIEKKYKYQIKSLFDNENIQNDNESCKKAWDKAFEQLKNTQDSDGNCIWDKNLLATIEGWKNTNYAGLKQILTKKQILKNYKNEIYKINDRQTAVNNLIDTLNILMRLRLAPAEVEVPQVENPLHAQFLG